MASAPPPQIFAPHRRAAARRRLYARQAHPGAARYLFEDIAEDVAERVAFLRHSPRRTLLLGDVGGSVRRTLGEMAGTVDDGDLVEQPGFAVIDHEQPWMPGAYDLIVSVFTLDTANDLPGALLHLRGALRLGGLALVTMLGAGSLPALRAIMMAADDERPAPRLHPQVDVRAGAQLMQRAGFADPVADSRALDVRFGALSRLVSDLRDFGLGNVLSHAGPPLNRQGFARAQAAFADAGDAQGRVTEHFELLTLSGWHR